MFAFQAFAQIDILSRGGPAGATETLVYKIFQRQTPDRLGEGSVMAVGLFVVTFVVTLGQFVDPRPAGALWRTEADWPLTEPDPELPGLVDAGPAREAPPAGQPLPGSAASPGTSC